ncbi:MAG TPA: hypothetical protein VI876_03180 [Dehalococcoidia bacterium]|nr:hypothetical protein [Dehalococcoidia bacterium]
MAFVKHPTRSKTAAAHRQMPAAEEFGLHAAILLLALSAVLVKVAG